MNKRQRFEKVTVWDVATFKKRHVPAVVEPVEEKSEPCAICLDDVEPGKTCQLIACGHSFHDICLQTWFVENKQCPVCRADKIQCNHDVHRTEVTTEILRYQQQEIERMKKQMKNLQNENATLISIARNFVSIEVVYE